MFSGLSSGAGGKGAPNVMPFFPRKTRQSIIFSDSYCIQSIELERTIERLPIKPFLAIERVFDLVASPNGMLISGRGPKIFCAPPYPGSVE